jgi:hypothetical protein
VIARGRAYSDVPPGAPVVVEGSCGLLEIALNRASASEQLGLEVGNRVRLLPPSLSELADSAAEHATTFAGADAETFGKPGRSPAPPHKRGS